ncbi:9563_t:CDS:1 [Ambispora leptoticha]|uniref:9563_t:CDS:1 n=1 Tax=Ambispora leptoticha TaxID=144679 RepID=A0A9N9CY11_9GLOM|nr:9563_t:CDS:1 [Ambispora leptoticha]
MESQNRKGFNFNSPISPSKALFNALEMVSPQNFLKRSKSTSSTRSEDSNTCSNKSESTSKKPLEKLNNIRFKRTKPNSPSKSDCSNSQTTTTKPSQFLLTPPNSPSSPTLITQIPQTNNNNSARIQFSSTISLTTYLLCAPFLDLKLVVPRTISFQEFKEHVSKIAGLDLSDDDTIAYFHSCTMTELDEELLKQEKNLTFINFLVRQEKLRRVANSNCWVNNMLWMRDQVEVTLVAKWMT